MDGAVERQFLTEFVVDHQRLIIDGPRERELVDQPVADMNDIVAAAAVHQHVILVTREPGIEPLDQPVERGTRDQFAALRAENAD